MRVSGWTAWNMVEGGLLTGEKSYMEGEYVNDLKHGDHVISYLYTYGASGKKDNIPYVTGER